jgi:hypothetical protein
MVYFIHNILTNMKINAWISQNLAPSSIKDTPITTTTTLKTWVMFTYYNPMV